MFTIVLLGLLVIFKYNLKKPFSHGLTILHNIKGDKKNNDARVLFKKSYRGIWETAIKKHSDSANFIYELLQNADDTKVTFKQLIFGTIRLQV